MMPLTHRSCALLLSALTAAGCVSAQVETPPGAGDPVAGDAVDRDAKSPRQAGEDAADSEPSPAELIEQAKALNAEDRFNDALDLLDKARRTYPGRTDLLAVLAKTFHLKADSQVAEGGFDLNTQFHYEDVIRTAKAILAIDADHLDARLLAASAHYQLGRLDEAKIDAQAAVLSAPESYGAHAMLGRVTLQQFVRATQSLQQQALQQQNLEKPAVEGEALAARTKLLNDLHETAKTALQHASAADPKRSFPWIKRGDLAAWSGDLDGALPHYQKGLELEPEATVDHEWLRGSVTADKLAALYDGAIHAYTRSKGASKQQAALLHWYAGRARFDLREWEQVDAHFLAALESRADLISSHQYLMISAYERGDEARAARHAMTFASEAPKTFADRIRGDDYTKAILRGMAQTSFDAGRMVECRELNHVVALAANTVDEWNNYALLCRETQQYAQSFQAYQRALELEQSPQLLNDAAVILQYHLSTEENLEIARTLYERAVERAEWMLTNESMTTDVEERTRTALRDARANLRRL